MTKEEILAELLKYHDPALAERPGMVTQIWENGEVTCQKCGPLLWQRTLHMFSSGRAHHELSDFLRENLPGKHGKHAYVFVPYDKRDRLADMVNNWKP